MKKISTILVISLIILNIHGQKPEDTEDWSIKPEVVTPGKGTLPPSDAIVLYQGPEDLSKWDSEKGGPASWKAEEILTVAPKKGGIMSKQSFGDVQLHVEWRAPEKVVGEGQDRGNSGIFLMGKYEVQVLDSYESETYYNGQAGSIYKQSIPLVNACLPPGEWQCYDIIFKAPVFDAQGNKTSSAFITVIHNGVLIQNHVEIQGTTEYIGRPKNIAHPAKLPIHLQDHDHPVSYRNIWIREL
ncbi:MAG: DUF1080 domain-containing protein [Bacteroidota bacterium]